jgi:diadenosine tetraphosphatase ApaH/serine/threonine PP2A family protein phosphatase
MRLAILSDVHGNLEALTACTAHARAQGAQGFVCLGDFVGYGAEPEATLKLLRALPGFKAVRGNHDEALFAAPAPLAPPGVNGAIAWTRTRLSPESLAYLESLPYLYRAGAATYAHASAHRPGDWDYLTQPGQIGDCLEAAGTPLAFIGHVHVPRVFYETPGGAIRELEPLAGIAVPLSAQARYVINVGSVGQPRDGNNAACYVLYDEEGATLTFHRLAYDYFETAAKIRAAGLNLFFAERLARGF